MVRWLAAVATVLALSGCGTATAGPHEAEAAPAAQVPAADSTSPEAGPSAVAELSDAGAFASRVRQVLTSLAAQSRSPSSEALRGAFVAAGAEESAIEVSIDVTPTGLEVDAMTGAVAMGGTCVFGQVRGGTATVSELPVLGDGRCFIGDQR